MALNPYVANLSLAEAWQLGYDEADSDVGRTFDDHPESERSRAYDLGRTAAEKERENGS